MIVGLGKGQLPDSAGILSTAGGGGFTKFYGVVLHNTDVGNQTATIYLVDALETGEVGTASSANILFSKELTPNETYVFNLETVVLLNRNDTVQGFATLASSINYILTGVNPPSRFI